jgi:hypothetical protein
MATTFSAENAQHNAPWWWKRLESSLLYLFSSLIMTFIGTNIVSQQAANIIVFCLAIGIISLKSIGIGMGETPSLPEDPRDDLIRRKQVD